jgi:iron complex outermembrane receptor protein
MNKFSRNSLSLAVAAHIIGGALLAQPVYAQGESEESEPVIEEIVVTGSHIRRSGYETRSPIQIIDRDQMMAEGASTVIDIAKNLTVNTGSFITQETGGLIGTAQFNVRGLGTGSTLTLINGRRAGKSATADGNGNQFFDVNQLPLMMIERIDVQTDGASATYGSEAVGGVVNIITRKGFDGAEFMVRAEDSSNSAHSFSGALGASSDTSNFTIYGTYYKQDRNSRSDFDWMTDRINPENRFYSSNGGPGNYQMALVDPSSGEYLGGSGSERPDPDCLDSGGVKTATSSRCRANFLDQVSIIPEEERIQVFAEGDIDISDSVKVYGEAHFSNNTIERSQGTSLFDRGLANGRMLIPADHPFNFWVDDGAGQLAYVDPSDWDNSIHTAVPLNVRGRPFGVEEFFSGQFEEDLEFRLN